MLNKCKTIEILLILWTIKRDDDIMVSEVIT